MFLASQFTRMSEIAAVVLTAIAPVIATLMKSGPIRQKLHLFSAGERRQLLKDVSEQAQVRHEGVGVAVETEVAGAVVLSEEEAENALGRSGSFAAPTPEEINALKPESGKGKIVLIAFVVVLLLYGFANLIFYWGVIRTKGSLVLWATGLLVTMIAGMFVQVISAKFRSGNPLFAVGAGELIFPVLFSPIVFYPIWGLAGNGNQSLFSYYAAFLNGYFWQGVVSAARMPTQK